MDFLVFETPRVAPEQTPMVFGIQPAHSYPFAENEMLERYPEAVEIGGRILERCFDLFPQPQFQNLVAVDLEHPLICTLWDGPVFLLRRLNVLMLNDARAILAANVE